MKKHLVMAALLASAFGALAQAPGTPELTPEQKAANWQRNLKYWYEVGNLVRCTPDDLEAERGNCARYASKFRGLAVAEAAWVIQGPDDKPKPIAIADQRPWPNLAAACNAEKLKGQQGGCAAYASVAALPGLMWIVPGGRPVKADAGTEPRQSASMSGNPFAAARDWIDGKVGERNDGGRVRRTAPDGK